MQWGMWFCHDRRFWLPIHGVMGVSEAARYCCERRTGCSDGGDRRRPRHRLTIKAATGKKLKTSPAPVDPRYPSKQTLAAALATSERKEYAFLTQIQMATAAVAILDLLFQLQVGASSPGSLQTLANLLGQIVSCASQVIMFSPVAILIGVWRFGDDKRE